MQSVQPKPTDNGGRRWTPPSPAIPQAAARAAWPASARPREVAGRPSAAGSVAGSWGEANPRAVTSDLSHRSLACRVSDLRLVWLQFAKPESFKKTLRRAWMAVGGRKRQQTQKQEGGDGRNISGRFLKKRADSPSPVQEGEDHYGGGGAAPRNLRP